MEFNRFDVSAKELVWDDPAGWLDGLGIVPCGPVEVIDSEITTLSAAADKVIKVGGDEPYLANIELQSSHETTLVRPLWYRQVALDSRNDLPVLTILVLLRPEANSPSLTGTYERRMPDGRFTNRYDYVVARLWREDAESFLNAGVGLVPLAPLTDVQESALPQLVRRMAERINVEPRDRAAKLWTATYLRMGSRYSDELTESLLEGIQTMQESVTYQRILREGQDLGRIAEAQRMLLLLGEARFGAPSEATRGRIEAIHDTDRLEAMSRCILDADLQDWQGLMNEP